MEVTNVTHVPWRVRLLQSLSLIGLLTVIALLARMPQWEKHPDEPVKWKPPGIDVIREARELTLDVAVVPVRRRLELKTRPGTDVALAVGDDVDLAMHNRSEQEVYVAVFTVNADNAVTWWVPHVTNAEQAAAVKAQADTKSQTLARVSVSDKTPIGRMDIIGMFFSDPVALTEVAASLHDGGMSALHNMQHVVSVDTVPVTVVAAQSPEVQ